MLTREQIIKFQQLYKNRFGEAISFEEAVERGQSLIRLVELVYRPIRKDEFSAIVKQEKNNARI